MDNKVTFSMLKELFAINQKNNFSIEDSEQEDFDFPEAIQDVDEDSLLTDVEYDTGLSYSDLITKNNFNPEASNVENQEYSILREGSLADRIRSQKHTWVSGSTGSTGTTGSTGSTGSTTTPQGMQIIDGVLYENGNVASGLKEYQGKFYYNGVIANGVVGHTLYLDGLKELHYSVSATDVFNAVKGRYGNITGNDIIAYYGNSSNNPEIRAVLGYFVDTDANGNYKTNELFDMVAYAGGHTHTQYSDDIITLAELTTALYNQNTYQNQQAPLDVNTTENLTMLENRAHFLKLMSNNNNINLTAGRVQLDLLRNNTTALQYIGADVFVGSTDTALDNYTWNLINGHRGHDSILDHNIDLKDILNASTDKTYFKNAKYAASLVRDLDKSNGTADSYLSANEVKNLYYSYLNNPKAENRDIMLNILGKLADKNANGTIKNFKTVSGNVTQELFQEIMKMLDSGTLKAENTNTVEPEIPASDSQSKTVLEVLQSITDKKHGIYLDSEAIVNAYNTTNDKTLKAILSVFVNVDSQTNMATGVNSTFNANKSHDTLGMSYVDLNKFFGVENWTTKIPVENLEELIK